MNSLTTQKTFTASALLPVRQQEVVHHFRFSELGPTLIMGFGAQREKIAACDERHEEAACYTTIAPRTSLGQGTNRGPLLTTSRWM